MTLPDPKFLFSDVPFLFPDSYFATLEICADRHASERYCGVLAKDFVLRFDWVISLARHEMRVIELEKEELLFELADEQWQSRYGTYRMYPVEDPRESQRQ